jgi:hypothetical protein
MESPLGGPAHWSAGLFLNIYFWGESRAWRPGGMAGIGGTEERFQLLES